VRVGLLGDTGTGKTHAARLIVAGYLEASPGVVLVADTKGEGRFEGQRFASPAALEGVRVAPEPRVLVFAGDPFAGVDLAPDEVAEFGWRLAARRLPSLAVLDELEAGCIAGQWRRGVSWIPRTFGQGRARGISCLWGTQSPQKVPLEAFEQSDEIWCWRLAGLGVRCLKERGYLEGVPAGTLEGLPGIDAPPARRGAFVRLLRGRAWDRRVYRF
jgi:hypothetical protein